MAKKEKETEDLKKKTETIQAEEKQENLLEKSKFQSPNITEA